MFVIRGLNGEMMFDTAIESNEEETVYQTYAEAQKTLEYIEQCLPKNHFKIISLNCERCSGENDVAIIHVNNDPKAFE